MVHDVNGIAARLREMYRLSWLTPADIEKATEYLCHAIDGPVDSLLMVYHGLVQQYLEAPASAGHHLAVKGGLLAHSLNVTDWLLKLTGDWGIRWGHPSSPYVIGMCHDLCKLNAYAFKTDDTEIAKLIPMFPGHGTLSAMLAPVFLGHPITHMEMACIVYHMGAWDLGRDYEAQNLDRAVREYPLQVIATHTADMLASQWDEKGM